MERVGEGPPARRQDLALVHRCEGPGDESVAGAAHAILQETAGDTDVANFSSDSNTWDADGFVDLCAKAVKSGGPIEQLCRLIQRRECELLLAHCYNEALRS